MKDKEYIEFLKDQIKQRDEHIESLSKIIEKENREMKNLLTEMTLSHEKNSHN